MIPWWIFPCLASVCAALLIGSSWPDRRGYAEALATFIAIAVGLLVGTVWILAFAMKEIFA